MKIVDNDHWWCLIIIMDDGEWMIYGDFACHYQPLLTIILGNGPWMKYDGDC